MTIPNILENSIASLNATKGLKVLQQNQEMLQNGITEEQKKKAYYPRISEALYHNIDPYVYSGQEESIKQAIKDAFFKPNIPDENKIVETPKKLDNEPLNSNQTGRLDAFRLYLGLPQKFGTFGISGYKPQNGSDDVTYFKIPEHEKIIKDPHYFKNLIHQVEKAKQGLYDNTDIKPIYSSGVSKNKGLITDFDPTTILGYYKMDLGKDERGNYLSYYDKWDLDPKVNDPSNIMKLAGIGVKMIGHPFEVYNRIYYDPKTKKPLD